MLYGWITIVVLSSQCLSSNAGLQVYFYRYPPTQIWQVEGLATWISTNTFSQNLDCNTTSNSGDGVGWTRQAGLNPNWMQVVTNGKRLTLDIGFTNADFGIYTCYDSATNESLNVNITNANPAIQAVNDVVTIEAGSSGQLKVYVSGFPDPTSTDISWFKVGPGGIKTELKEPTVNFSSDHHTLQLTNVQESDGGTYMCIVKQSMLVAFPTASSTVQVTIKKIHITSAAATPVTTSTTYPGNYLTPIMKPTTPPTEPATAPPTSLLTEARSIIIAMAFVTGICILTVILMPLGFCACLWLGRQRGPIGGLRYRCATHDTKSNPFCGARLQEYNYTDEPLNKSTRSGAQDPHHTNDRPVQNDSTCNRLQRDFNCPAATVLSCRSAAAGTPAETCSITCSPHSSEHTSRAWQGRSPYATPLPVGQVHTHAHTTDATPAPYLTPSVQSINRRLPPPPHYEDVKSLSTAQHDPQHVEFVSDSFPLQVSSHQRALEYDVHPYAITKNSEISLISETEV